MGLTGLFGYCGDMVLEQAAHTAGIPMLMSAASLIPMEDAARHAPSAWFLAYLPMDLTGH
jgi:L-lactate dehydrogenase (cytochrome)